MRFLLEERLNGVIRETAEVRSPRWKSAAKIFLMAIIIRISSQVAKTTEVNAKILLSIVFLLRINTTSNIAGIFARLSHPSFIKADRASSKYGEESDAVSNSFAKMKKAIKSGKISTIFMF